MQVALALPKFTFGWGGSVKPQLQGLGINSAFTDSADFSGISAEKPGLKISDVFHKTFVAVDEEGTEAAAATGVVMATRGLVMPVAFKADRPFLFLVRNPKNGTLFFFGRVANPAQK
jgi:serpin B